MLPGKSRFQKRAFFDLANGADKRLTAGLGVRVELLARVHEDRVPPCSHIQSLCLPVKLEAKRTLGRCQAGIGPQAAGLQQRRAG